MEKANKPMRNSVFPDEIIEDAKKEEFEQKME